MKKTIEEEITQFLDYWDFPKMQDFMRDIVPLMDLYDNENEDWVKNAVGEDNELNVTIVRSVYLISRIAEMHAGRLCYINASFKRLWERMEKIAQEQKTGEIE